MPCSTPPIANHHKFPVEVATRRIQATLQGSGISEGEYVTLGAHEVEDLEVLVEFIRGGGHTSVIALWGRSMGAVTSLLYSERDPSVAALILDSPFSRLTDLMRELAEEQKIPLWSMLGGTALRLMRRCAARPPDPTALRRVGVGPHWDHGQRHLCLA